MSIIAVRRPSPSPLSHPNSTPLSSQDVEATPSESSTADSSQSFSRQSIAIPKPTSPKELRVFLSTFLTVFVAEIGDKTQVTTLLMSAESQSPWVVFTGAGVALVLTSLLGVLVGKWLSKRVSIQTLETVTGTILLVIAVLLLWDVVQLG
ncbi:MAG: TMEM165/GDT1 family protein [Elainellaceae cyanobacterium]